MKTAIAIRHVAFEGLDGFKPALLKAGYDVSYVDACSGALLENRLRETGLLIVLGGPIGAYETDNYPFLADELRLIGERLESGRPLMGICLGAQLIAQAAGAQVYASGGKEIGFASVSLTEEGRQSCLAPFAEEPVTLHWHGDTFDIPAGGVRLASTDFCENQAFALGANVLGFQFHPEATGANMEHWLVGHAAELSAAGIDIGRLRADAIRYGPALQRKAYTTAMNWLEQLEQ